MNKLIRWAEAAPGREVLVNGVPHHLAAHRHVTLFHVKLVQNGRTVAKACRPVFGQAVAALEGNL